MLTGCSVSSSAELQGKYVAHYSFGSEELILKPGGTYEQIIHVKGDPEPIVSVGTWTYYRDWPQGRVEFTNFRAIADMQGNLIKKYRTTETGNARLPVERQFLVGRIRLGPDVQGTHVKE